MTLERSSEQAQFVGDIREEALGLAITVARYGLTVGPMVRRVQNNESILPLAALTLALDVADGVATRFISKSVLGSEWEDTPIRRIADGVLDHATVAKVGWEVAKKNPATLPYLGVFAGRALVAAAGMNGYHLAKTNQVTKGRKWQKATHVAAAAFGITANSGNRKMTHLTGAIASGIALATIPAHLKHIGSRTENRFREL